MTYARSTLKSLHTRLTNAPTTYVVERKQREYLIDRQLQTQLLKVLGAAMHNALNNGELRTASELLGMTGHETGRQAPPVGVKEDADMDT